MAKSKKRHEDSWRQAAGAGSPKTPRERLSLAAEIFVVHERFDEPSALARDSGLLVNRHVWPGRSIALPPPIGRDSPGEDETPAGAYISLASRPRGEDGMGGELPARDGTDRRTAHQRDWDFLETHVRQAYARHQGRELRCQGLRELSPWQQVAALAEYAMLWKMRTPQVYASFHPVDVLLHSSYCTGAANVLHALAMVAGFESRSIAMSNHSTVEIRVNGRWIWADNIWDDGGVTPCPCDFATVTEDPNAIACLTPKQRDLYASPVAAYRSNYHYAGRCYWHFCWGDRVGRGARDDVTDGYGLSVPCDPSTAAALYPEKRRHVFHVPRGWPPAVCLSEQGALVETAVALPPSLSLRKRFHVGASPDNPLRGGKVKLILPDPADAGAYACAVDGEPLCCLGSGRRWTRPTAEFDLPAALLTPGEHDLVVSAARGAPRVLLYPDIVEPYFGPALSRPLDVPDTAFRVRPCLGAAEVNALTEDY